MCPIGRLNGESREGLGISKAWVGSGCASAAAPSHGSAFACGATPITAISPTATARDLATDMKATQTRGDIAHLSPAGTSHRRQQLTTVTIVSTVTLVFAESWMDTGP